MCKSKLYIKEGNLHKAQPWRALMRRLRHENRLSVEMTPGETLSEVLTGISNAQNKRNSEITSHMKGQI